MDRVEKASALIEQAEKLGLKLEFRHGVIVAVRQKPAGDHERQDAICAELVKHVRDVHRLLRERETGVRAKELVGQRIFYADGEGVLASAAGDGSLVIAVRKEGTRNPLTLRSNADSLLIVLDEGEENGTAEPAAEQPRKGFLERLRGN